MKRNLLLALVGIVIGFSGAVFAAPVNSTQAANAVRGWLQTERSPLGANLGSQIARIETHRDAVGAPLYHIVYLQPAGFVIVAADDAAEPIVAFVSQGSFDPSENNPLGALVARDLPKRMAQAHKLAGTPAALGIHAKWQKLLDNWQNYLNRKNGGSVQPKSLSNGSISDLRVTPFINTLWDQSTVDNFVVDLITLNNQITVRTHFDTNLVGNIVATSAVFPNNAVSMLVTPVAPAIHSFSFSKTIDVNNGPNSTVTNIILVTLPIQITISNAYNEIIFSQSFTTNFSVTNIVSGGSQGATIESQVPFTIQLTEIVNDKLACYNFFTPSHAAGDPANAVCGCVATLLAQTMYYFQYPTTGVGTNLFTFSFDSNPVLWSWPLRGGDGKGGPYDWANMSLDPEGPPPASLNQRAAIGALTYDAGIAVHMAYTDTSAGSGALMSDAQTALITTFKYGNAVITESNSINVGFDLADMVNADLDARLPVLFGIDNSLGGHAIVCDGYGYDAYNTLYHHLNMGWGGTDNAWYHLPLIDLTDTVPYNNFNACIYNVFTNGTGEIISGRVVDNSGIPLANVNVTAVTPLGAIFTAVSDSHGIYALAGLPSNTAFTLTAAANGYFLRHPARVHRSFAEWSCHVRQCLGHQFLPVVRPGAAGVRHPAGRSKSGNRLHGVLWRQRHRPIAVGLPVAISTEWEPDLV